MKGTVSYNDLAAQISNATNRTASRQAYFYRTNERTVEFFKHILAAVIKKKYHVTDIDLPNRFKRVLIHDSTIIKLPDKFYETFSGVSNGLATVCNARIQGVYDILSGNFVSFSIDPYCKNDLIAAPEIQTQPGDLVIRDRGYFLLSAIERLKRDGADSLLRYKHKTIFYDPMTLKEIDLLKRLQVERSLDIIAVAGKEKNIKVRILAVAVPEEVANIRRMKAKKEAKKRGCSYELLQLLGWTIFVTTIEDASFTIQDACNLYSLRWRIESIFKTWKSNFSFGKFHNISEVQLWILLHARLIIITVAYQCLYKPLEVYIYQQLGKQLSLLKFMRFFTRGLIDFIAQYISVETKDAAIQKVARYCCYDKRRRGTFLDKMKFVQLT